MRFPSTHASRLDRWLGAGYVETVLESMRRWYGPPIPLLSGRGDLLVHAGGAITGQISGGGFASLSDLIAESTGGKRREFVFQKVGVTGVVGVSMSLWRVGNQPAAAGAASAAPGGDAPTDATTGAILLDNVSPDTRHVVSAAVTGSVIANTLLLYDRIFQVQKLANSTATEAVTGVPTRYQSTTATAADYIGGNFLFVECTTVLPATAHNWTVCTYLDHANAASTLPSLTGNASAIAGRLDQPAQQWFAPLETGDVGVKALTQMQSSALLASGVINFVIGHPLAFLPVPVANMMMLHDFINTAFNLSRIFDDAALAFLEIVKPATGATTYSGTITAVHG